MSNAKYNVKYFLAKTWCIQNYLTHRYTIVPMNFPELSVILHEYTEVFLFYKLFSLHTCSCLALYVVGDRGDKGFPGPPGVCRCDPAPGVSSAPFSSYTRHDTVLKVPAVSPPGVQRL